jgi:hypothetical protein
MESYYIIKSKIDNYIKHYYVNVFETEYEYNILIGGVKIKCVNIIINKTNNIALLELFQHHFNCSLFSDLKKGDEVIDLLKNSLFFAVSKYPDVKYFEFIDNSFILCKNKKRISLPDLTFIKYNKTWYEQYFKAVPSKNSKDDIIMIKEIIMKKLNKKIKMTYDDFINKYYSDPIFKKNNIVNIIKNSYHKNIIFKDFLDKLKEYDCIFYEKLFNDFIGNLLQGTKWIISIKTVNNYNINSDIIDTEKIKDNDDLNKLFNKLTKLNIKEQNHKGGNVYNGGILCLI